MVSEDKLPIDRSKDNNRRTSITKNIHGCVSIACMQHNFIMTTNNKRKSVQTAHEHYLSKRICTSCLSIVYDFLSPTETQFRNYFKREVMYELTYTCTKLDVWWGPRKDKAKHWDPHHSTNRMVYSSYILWFIYQRRCFETEPITAHQPVSQFQT